jgi:hypothetical protein
MVRNRSINDGASESESSIAIIDAFERQIHKLDVMAVLFSDRGLVEKIVWRNLEPCVLDELQFASDADST